MEHGHIHACGAIQLHKASLCSITKSGLSTESAARDSSNLYCTGLHTFKESTARHAQRRRGGPDQAQFNASESRHSWPLFFRLCTMSVNDSIRPFSTYCAWAFEGETPANDAIFFNPLSPSPSLPYLETVLLAEALRNLLDSGIVVARHGRKEMVLDLHDAGSQHS